MLTWRCRELGFLSTADEDPLWQSSDQAGVPDSCQEQYNWIHHSGQVTGRAGSNIHAAFRLATEEQRKIRRDCWLARFCPLGKRKEKDKERKEKRDKDHYKPKQKKKKKKKKKSKQHGKDILPRCLCRQQRRGCPGFLSQMAERVCVPSALHSLGATSVDIENWSALG